MSGQVLCGAGQSQSDGGVSESVSKCLSITSAVAERFAVANENGIEEKGSLAPAAALASVGWDAFLAII